MGRRRYSGAESDSGDPGSSFEDTECKEDYGNIWVMFFMSYVM